MSHQHLFSTDITYVTREDTVDIMERDVLYHVYITKSGAKFTCQFDGATNIVNSFILALKFCPCINDVLIRAKS